jgi:hypothetical protein
MVPSLTVPGGSTDGEAQDKEKVHTHTNIHTYT